MAIILRNGLMVNFDPAKLRVAELAFVTDTKKLYLGVGDSQAEEVMLQKNMDTEKAERQAADEELQNNIDALRSAIGSPLVASTAAEMTDTNRVYVYVGSETGYANGHWYYYNGTAWADGGVYNAVAFETDKELDTADMAADAKATGDEIRNLKSGFTQIFSENAKNALIDIFKHLYWKDEQGEDQLNILRNALFEGSYPKIVATFNPGENVIYTDDPLDSLKQYLTVKYYESVGATGVIVTNYTIRGTLIDGQSTINIQYGDVGTSITIDTIDYYNIHKWVMGDNIVTLGAGGETSLNDETRYPSRISFYYNVTRKTNVVTKGKTPFYMWNETAVPTEYYPIPIPANANHIKITTLPNTQNVYLHTIPYLADSNKYGNSMVNNRISWEAVDSNGVIEKDIENPGNLFAVVNLRYNSSNAQYPDGAPSQVIIEFSEV